MSPCAAHGGLLFGCVSVGCQESRPSSYEIGSRRGVRLVPWRIAVESLMPCGSFAVSLWFGLFGRGSRFLVVLALDCFGREWCGVGGSGRVVRFGFLVGCADLGLAASTSPRSGSPLPGRRWCLDPRSPVPALVVLRSPCCSVSSVVGVSDFGSEWDVLRTVRDNLLKDRGELRFGVSKFEAGIAIKVFGKAPCAVCRASVANAGRLVALDLAFRSLPVIRLSRASWSATSMMLIVALWSMVMIPWIGEQWCWCWLCCRWPLAPLLPGSSSRSSSCGAG